MQNLCVIKLMEVSIEIKKKKSGNFFLSVLLKNERRVISENQIIFSGNFF